MLEELEILLESWPNLVSPYWLLLVLLQTFTPARAQTVFAPGDIAIVGLASNVGDDDLTAYCENGAGIGDGRDRISIVCFKPLTTGTVLDFTDNGWERVFPGMWGNTEGFLRITRTGATIPAGTTITFEFSRTGGPLPIGIAPDNAWNFAELGTRFCNFGSGGDQLYLMQGGAWNSGSGCPFFCANDATYTGGVILFAITSNGWVTGPPGSADNVRFSRLHPDVATCYNLSTNNIFASYQNPTASTSQQDWMNRILNINNWNVYNDCTVYVEPPGNFPIIPTAQIQCTAGKTGCQPLVSTFKLDIALPATAGPFTVKVTNGTDTISLTNATDDQIFNISNNSSTTWKIVSLLAAGINCPVTPTFGAAVPITVFPGPVADDFARTLCADASIDLATQAYSGSNLAGSTFTFHSALPPAAGNQLLNTSVTVTNNVTYYAVAASGNGCRDTFPIALTAHVNDTVYVAATSCNPANVGTSTQTLLSSIGCDSLVITNTTLRLADTTYINTTTCSAVNAGVTTQLLVNVNGCDSLIITNTTLLPADTTYLTAITCSAANAGVTTQLLVNVNGCDSLVITNTTLLPADTTYLTAITCSAANAGVTTQLLVNVNGCDSLIITNTTLLPADTTYLMATTCNAANAGVITQLLTNVNGCDSLIITNTTLLPADTTYLTATTCNAANVGVTTQLLTSVNGCDSLVITNTTLLPADTTFLTATTCSAANVGVTTQLLTSVSGCDSLVITNTALLPADTTFLTATTCSAANVGVTTQLLTSVSGCDSLVITNTTLLPADTTFLNATTCNAANAGVTTQLLTSVSGCDSLVITNTTLLPADTTFLNASTCNAANAGVTTQLLTSVSGCDSLVITNTTLLPADTTFLNATTCNAANAGVTTQLLTSVSGCDSLVITNTTLLPADTTFLNATTCNAANVGLTTQLLASVSGCDSLVITNTTLLPADTTFLTATTCNPDSVGTTLAMFTSSNGCDSIVLTTLSFEELTLNIPAPPAILLGDSVMFMPLINFSPDQLFWEYQGYIDCDTCLEPVVKPEETTQYKLTVFDAKGCSVSAFVQVVVEVRDGNLYVPNAFAPERGGVNGVFSIYADAAIAKLRHFEVFDRWGEQVFARKDILPNVTAEGWDGTINGSQGTPGVYVWWLEVEYLDGSTEIKKGEVTLIR